MRGDMDEKLSRLNSKASRLQRACLELYREHVSYGAIPTSGRFKFYELEDRGVVPEAYRRADGTPLRRAPAQDVSDALTRLREVGLIPWEHIIDETRSLHSWAYARSVTEFLLEEVSLARIDVWGRTRPSGMSLCASVGDKQRASEPVDFAVSCSEKSEEGIVHGRTGCCFGRVA
jgi:hypothetical protein